MTEFQLFNKALIHYETKPKNTVSQPSHCTHLDVFIDKGITICTECGEEINRSDFKREFDSKRVQARKIEDRNIYKDVENLGFSENIVNKANKIYSQVTGLRIYRGNS